MGLISHLWALQAPYGPYKAPRGSYGPQWWTPTDEKLPYAALSSRQLDPQYWYDKAIERVFNAKNDFDVHRALRGARPGG